MTLPSRLTAATLGVLIAALAGCDARTDPNSGSGSAASAPAVAASRQQLDPH